MQDKWALADGTDSDRRSVLSMHPNREGAKLSALRYVQNGDSIYWEDRKLPVQVASDIGVVNGKDRFVIYLYA